MPQQQPGSGTDPEIVPIPVQVTPTFDPPDHPVGTVEVKIEVDLPVPEGEASVDIQSINLWIQGGGTKGYLQAWHQSLVGSTPIETLDKVKAEQTVYMQFDANYLYTGIVAKVTYGAEEGTNTQYIFNTPH